MKSPDGREMFPVQEITSLGIGTCESTSRPITRRTDERTGAAGSPGRDGDGQSTRHAPIGGLASVGPTTGGPGVIGGRMLTSSPYVMRRAVREMFRGRSVASGRFEVTDELTQKRPRPPRSKGT
jgi:hypothetical protein